MNELVDIEKLKAVSDFLRRNSSGAGSPCVIHADEVDKAIAALPRWRDVREELPEDGAVVWVSAGHKFPQFQTDAEFKGGKFFLWSQEAEEHVFWDQTVTHWQEIVPPPHD